MGTPRVHEVSGSDIRAMREWAADCLWLDVDEAEIFELSAHTIIRGVDEHYDGGVAGFVASLVVAA
jgi:hypothetical protein